MGKLRFCQLIDILVINPRFQGSVSHSLFLPMLCEYLTGEGIGQIGTHCIYMTHIYTTKMENPLLAITLLTTKSEETSKWKNLQFQSGI